MPVLDNDVMSVIVVALEDSHRKLLQRIHAETNNDEDEPTPAYRIVRVDMLRDMSSVARVCHQWRTVVQRHCATRPMPWPGKGYGAPIIYRAGHKLQSRQDVIEYVVSKFVPTQRQHHLLPYHELSPEKISAIFQGVLGTLSNTEALALVAHKIDTKCDHVIRWFAPFEANGGYDMVKLSREGWPDLRPLSTDWNRLFIHNGLVNLRMELLYTQKGVKNVTIDMLTRVAERLARVRAIGDEIMRRRSTHAYAYHTMKTVESRRIEVTGVMLMCIHWIRAMGWSTQATQFLDALNLDVKTLVDQWDTGTTFHVFMGNDKNRANNSYALLWWYNILKQRIGSTHHDLFLVAKRGIFKIFQMHKPWDDFVLERVSPWCTLLAHFIRRGMRWMDVGLDDVKPVKCKIRESDNVTLLSIDEIFARNVDDDRFVCALATSVRKSLKDAHTSLRYLHAAEFVALFYKYPVFHKQLPILYTLMHAPEDVFDKDARFKPKKLTPVLLRSIFVSRKFLFGKSHRDFFERIRWLVEDKGVSLPLGDSLFPVVTPSKPSNVNRFFSSLLLVTYHATGGDMTIFTSLRTFLRALDECVLDTRPRNVWQQLLTPIIRDRAFGALMQFVYGQTLNIYPFLAMGECATGCVCCNLFSTNTGIEKAIQSFQQWHTQLLRNALGSSADNVSVSE